MKLIPDTYHSGWTDFLNQENVKEELLKLEKFLENKAFFPDEKSILRFLTQDPNVKVILVGMEPYPSSYEENGIIYPEATGRSFEVASVKKWTNKFKQTSMRNILKAIYLTYYGNIVSMDQIRSEIKDGTFPISPPKQWFDNLEDQGVMFLNATLTVEQYHVDTHTKQWENFVNYLIEYIELINPDVIWCLLGTKAKDRFLPNINKEHAIITCHPRLNEFIESGLFEKLKNKVNFLI